jgi:hypothetical protein
MSSIDELIAGSVEAAATDPAWLGSSEQLGFLAESLPGFGVENALHGRRGSGDPASGGARGQAGEGHRQPGRLLRGPAEPRSPSLTGLRPSRPSHVCVLMISTRSSSPDS